ncbi:MAG: GtrA family protein [Phycisphaerae bacterium]
MPTSDTVQSTAGLATPDVGAAARSLGDVAVVIPAYKPTPALLDVVKDLSVQSFAGIVVVDDGSGPAFRALFDQVQAVPGVRLMRHAVNLGKGMALRTGLNAAAVSCPGLIGVVTADADGQHLSPDIVAVARGLQADGQALVMGCRQFAGEVPLRSRFGNLMTVAACRMVLGMRLSDTQTGLRGIPMEMIPGLLRLRSVGYEFELDMLLLNKYRGGRLKEVPISTVYIDENQSSHFNPLIDSVKIYFTLLRFSLTSAASALLDYGIFTAALACGSSIGMAQIIARAISMFFNYAAVRKVVFFSRRKHSVVFPRYLLLVILSGLASWGIMSLLALQLHVTILVAKPVAEVIVFLANFTIQRDFIFGSPSAGAQPAEGGAENGTEVMPAEAPAE